MINPKIPPNLGPSGRSLWKSFVPALELEIGDVELLATACHTADELSAIEAALRGAPAAVEGPGGRLTPNPLFEEARRHRTTLASLIAKLVPAAEAGPALSTSEAARQVVAARWNKPGARRSS